MDRLEKLPPQVIRSEMTSLEMKEEAVEGLIGSLQVGNVTVVLNNLVLW